MSRDTGRATFPLGGKLAQLVFAGSILASIVAHAAVVASAYGVSARGAGRDLARPLVEVIDLASPPIVVVDDEPISPQEVATPAPRVDALPPAAAAAPAHNLASHSPAVAHPAPEAADATRDVASAAETLHTDARASPTFTILVPTAPDPNANTNGAIGVAARRAAPTAEAPAIEPESRVSTPARLVASALASYPPDARENGIEADVPVEIVVDVTGSVIEARVVRPAGFGFDEAALGAIRRYRFSAARRDGRAVRVRMHWSVQFRLH